MADQAIQSAVESALKCIWDSLPSPSRFLATHFSCGTPGLPGYIIKSAAYAKSCRFADWAGEDQSLHANVIIRHARQFQRSVTVPALLAMMSSSNRMPVILTLRVSTSQEPLLVSREEKDKCIWFSVELSQGFAAALCPPELPETYLKTLYDNARQNRRSDSLSEGELRPFDLPRCEAFGLLIANSSDLQSNVEALFPEKSGEVKVKTWNLLGTLQSALLYFEASRIARDNNEASGFACAFPLQKQGEHSETPFGFCLGGPLVAIKSHEIRQCLSDNLWTDKVREHVNGEDLEKKHIALTNALSKATGMAPNEVQRIAEILESEIVKVVPFKGQQKRLRLIGLWLIYLVSRLKGAKHEGKPIDFWFVAGERTEFADDADVRLEKHPLRIKVGGTTKDDEEFSLDKFERSETGLQLNDKVCNLIIRRLEKEHYPWFSRGRYSLFFDISTAGLEPSGLAEMRSGAWNKLVTESFKLPDEQELRVPGCLVAFIDGASGEAGLLVCQPAKHLQKARVKRTFRLRAGRWQLPSDERQKVLEKHIRENVPWLKGEDVKTEPDDVKMISQMSAMIADDPHAGGILVFLDGADAANSFVQLGAPWEFNVFHQDKIPLISHDGATIVWKNDKNEVLMAYRQLLTPENGDGIDKVIGLLQTRSLGNDSEFPLLGVGTRRWSAALCALRKNVKMVVVISTDGDLTCWWGKLDAVRQLWYHHLPVDFDEAKHGVKNVLA
jgi:hypothetical protein